MKVVALVHAVVTARSLSFCFCHRLLSSWIFFSYGISFSTATFYKLRTVIAAWAAL